MYYQNKGKAMGDGDSTALGAGFPLVEPLSDRELEILRLLANDHTNQQIADALHLALSTVKWYNTQIYGKLGVQDRDQAVSRAYQLGVLDDGNFQGRGNLPRLTSPFIGRQTELTTLEQLVRDRASPLITLLGAGGMGKTTLAVMAAYRLHTHFGDGAYFVPLATTQTPAQMITSIAEHLRFQFRQDAEPLQQQLFDYLATQEVLLVLDNFEHLLEGASLLTELVQTAPDLTLLVTSRERLNLASETVYALEGLVYPDGETLTAASQQADAVQLFIQSARRTRADYQLSRDDVPHVAAICRLVGGMPLAIELAAGWIGILTPEQIVAEIQEGIDILETDMRDIPARQHSVRATLDYSWARLTESERKVFMGLTVFERDFDVIAAKEVAGADARVLRQLFNKGLVVSLASGRHRIHQLLRQYGTEKLIEAGQLESVYARHAQYFAELLRGMYNGSYSLQRQPARGIIERDLDNVIAAWRYMTRAPLLDHIPITVDCLVDYVDGTARYFEGQDWLSEGYKALRDAPSGAPVPPGIIGHVLTQLAAIHMGTDIDKAKSLVMDAIRLLEPLGPSASLAWAYITLGNPYRLGLKDYAEQDAALQKARAIAVEIDDPLYIGGVASLQAMAHFQQGNLAVARELAEEALSVVSGLHIEHVIQTAKYVLAMVHSSWRDYAVALDYLHQLMDMTSGFGNVYFLTAIQAEIATVHLRQGELDRARDHMRQYVQLHVAHARDWQIVGAIFGVAEMWYLPRGQLERAVELLAFAHHHPLATVCKAPAGQGLKDLEAELEPQTFAAAYARGRTLELDTIVDDLLKELSG